MKLLTKSTFLILFISIFVFIISGIAVYFLVESMIRDEVDESLYETRLEIIYEIKEKGGFANFVIPKDSSIEFGQLLQNIPYERPQYKDTLFSSDFEDELIPYREMVFTHTYKKETRNVYVYRSLIESDELIEGLIYSFSIVFIFMAIALITTNYLGMHYLWKPFHTIMQHIRDFNFRNNEGFQVVETDVLEFNELNRSLQKMTLKLTRDYNSLKEFSENASHEMQTPLAIIQAKLELLIQQKDRDTETRNAINAAYQAVHRLSRLHYELNLLTRIENKEFAETESIAFKSVAEDQVENFSDILHMKKYNVSVKIEADPVVNGNAYLVEILVSNLLNNAIKHNIPGGKIDIELTDKFFRIANSGQPPSTPPEIFFERFKKEKSSAESVGLGLALVKQICLFHDFKISYSYENKLHVLMLEF